MEENQIKNNSFKTMVSYLKPFTLQTIVGPIAKMTEAIIELLTPIIMGFMIDSVIEQNREVEYYFRFGIIFLLLQILAAAFSFLCQYMASVASQGVGTNLRTDVFSKIQSLSFRQLDKFGAVSLSNRLTLDIANMQVAVALFIRLFFRAPLLLVGATIAAFIISPLTAIVFIPVIIFVSGLLAYIMGRTLPIQEEAQEGTDNLGMLVQDYLTGVRIIRAFNKSDHEREYFEDSSETVNEKLVKSSRLSSILTPASTFVVNIAILVVLFFGGDMIQVGSLSSGELIALINYLNLLMQAVTVSTNLLIQVPRTVTSSNRLTEILTTEPDIVQMTEDEINQIKIAKDESFSDEYPNDIFPETNIDTDAALSLNHVYFRYSENANYVLEDIKFSLKPGRNVGIMGSTGSGKSSIARIIQRFYDPSYGEIYIQDQDIRSLSRKDIVNSIAFVPQKAVLFKGTIRSNLLLSIDAEEQAKLGEEELEKRLWQALEIAQAKDFVEALPKQLDAQVDRNGRNFSGGQRQRLCIARALVRRTSIIILDDAASALDYGTEARLNKALNNLEWDPALIVISQRIRSMINLDEIILLNTGRLEARGNHEELLATSKLYREIYESQEKS